MFWIGVIVVCALLFFGSLFIVSDLHKAVIPTIVALVALVVTGFCSFAQVSTGHVGLVYSFGSITDQIEEGFQLIPPWASYKEASLQIQSHKFEDLSSFTLETQPVSVTATLNIQVDRANIQRLFRDVGPNYFEVLVRPRVLQTFKDETVRYAAVDIAPNRETIRQNVRTQLVKELAHHSITVQDLLIDNIEFSPRFMEAVEEKQQQTQASLTEAARVATERAKADQKIEVARGTAESLLIVAKKQAEANRTIAESLTPEYVQYLYAEKLAPNVQVMMVPANQPFMFDLNSLKRSGP